MFGRQKLVKSIIKKLVKWVTTEVVCFWLWAHSEADKKENIYTKKRETDRKLRYRNMIKPSTTFSSTCLARFLMYNLHVGSPAV